jgi:hypothetical protein
LGHGAAGSGEGNVEVQAVRCARWNRAIWLARQGFDGRKLWQKPLFEAAFSDRQAHEFIVVNVKNLHIFFPCGLNVIMKSRRFLPRALPPLHTLEPQQYHRHKKHGVYHRERQPSILPLNFLAKWDSNALVSFAFRGVEKGGLDLRVKANRH